MDEVWDPSFSLVRLLKEDASRGTILLEDRQGSGRRFICKWATGNDAALLRREYDILLSLPAPLRFETLLLREEKNGCRLLRDYVSGSTLEELIMRNGPCSPRETAELGVKLCQSLSLLHGSNPPIIHRDLKPENILLTELGQVRLIDFGAARVYKPGQREDTILLGTKGYAAPEQYGSRQTDTRTDIYAVGKILCFTLAGGYTDEPKGLTKDKALEKILLRCCSYDPDRRYADVASLQKDLEKYLNLGAISPKMLSAAALLGILVCLACGAAGFFLGKNAPKPAAAVSLDAVGWDPFLRKPNVTKILRLIDEENWPDLAAECEKLVTSLTEDPIVSSVEPVAFWEMDGAELADYYASRISFEFIADDLAYGDYLAFSRLGTYEPAMPQFARNVRSRTVFLATDDTGQTQSSALHLLIVEGDDSNIDGCVIEIIEELNRALESTAASQ